MDLRHGRTRTRGLCPLDADQRREAELKLQRERLDFDEGFSLPAGSKDATAFIESSESLCAVALRW